MVPSRTHFSTILSEIKTLNSKIDSLTQSLPTIIQSQLHHFNDRRCLTIYGLPEDSTTKKKVNAIFNLVSISPSNVSILHRLGKPRQDGLSRPLKISIKDGIPFPRLIDLSTAMKCDPSMSTFHVRKFETPEQRKAGFLARQSKRDAARAEVTDQTTTPPNPADANLQTDMEVVEQPRNVLPPPVNECSPIPTLCEPESIEIKTPEPVPKRVFPPPSSVSTVITTPPVLTIASLDWPSLQKVQKAVSQLHLMCRDETRFRYSAFYRYYKCDPHLAPFISDVYFARYGFRFHINPLWEPLPPRK